MFSSRRNEGKGAMKNGFIIVVLTLIGYWIAAPGDSGL